MTINWSNNRKDIIWILRYSIM